MGKKSYTKNHLSIDEQIALAVEFTRAYQENTYKGVAEREAACLACQYPAMMCPPQADDVLVGRIQQPLVMFSPQNWSVGYTFNANAARQWREAGTLTADQLTKLDELENFWKNECTEEQINNHCTPEVNEWILHTNLNTDRRVAHSLFRMAGTNLDFNKLVHLGVNGLHRLIDEKQKYKRADSYSFYMSLHKTLDIFTGICDYYIKEIDKILADEAADETWKREMTKTQVSLKRIATSPAETFRDALQLVYLWWLFSGSVEFGRIDTYLAEFYVHDVDTGVISEQEAGDLLLELWKCMELRGMDYDMRAFLGGKGRENVEACDRFDILAINTTRRFHSVVPQLSLRLYEGMNSKVYDVAIQAIAEGCTFPILYNDEANIPAVSKAFQVSEEVATNYCPFGCGEYVLNHMSVGTPSATINLTKALEAALFHGRDAETNAIISPDFGGLEQYETFDDVLSAYKKVVEHFVLLLAQFEETEYIYCAKQGAYLALSMLFDDCISRGRPIYDGGIRYLGGTLESYGDVNAADSLTAIKKAVYEDKIVSREELLEALKNNFAGYDILRKQLLQYPKYGNENEEADNMLLEVHNHVCNTTRNSVVNTIMHSYMVVVINNSANTVLGHLTSASADGRPSGLHLANANNPQGGADTNGLTCMLNSILKPAIDIHAGCVQNLKLSKRMFSEGMIDKTRALLDAYFKKGGAQIMITVVNRNELEDAIVHPEEHKDLIVRVGGFSARFIELGADIQQEILSRTLHG